MQLKKLLENYSAEDLAAALLKELSNDSDVKVKITPEKPLPYRGKRRDGHRGGKSDRGRNKGKNFKGGKHFDKKRNKHDFRIRGRKG